ncbi:MAG: preprotein translocase subunit SecG [Cyclobacteriaceae bacterium]|nr:preprotein translocase subunit SecG [Cyclobacteriaceae bacterium]MCX7637944.1 preprotein translocase subunit SecG [Cyclobacteriaceae bacterium]MDW8332172.1 preprotein translocase subunit SecG [Cyclobacteriaceae bacterium]
MLTFITALILFSCVLLVLVILAQNAKGGGLTSQFGGSGATHLIGVKKTGDLLERLTWGFAVAIMVLSLSTNFISKNTSSGGSTILEKASEQAAPSQPQNQELPGTGNADSAR